MPRRKYNFEQHLSKTVHLCRKGTIELHKTEDDSTIVRLIPSTCKSIHCPHCSSLKARKYFNRSKAILSSGNFRFLTLTSSSQTYSIHWHLQHMLDSWEFFIKELKKYYPKLQYIRVIERHKSGYVHFHVCINTFIPQAQILKIWRKYETKGFAYIISVPIERQAKYICKYIVKQQWEHDETSKSIYEIGARIFQSSNVKVTNNYKAEYYFANRYETSIEQVLSLLHQSAVDNAIRIIEISTSDKEKLLLTYKVEPINYIKLKAS
jgi:hypothetical protein